MWGRFWIFNTCITDSWQRAYADLCVMFWVYRLPFIPSCLCLLFLPLNVIYGWSCWGLCLLSLEMYKPWYLSYDASCSCENCVCVLITLLFSIFFFFQECTGRRSSLTRIWYFWSLTQRVPASPAIPNHWDKPNSPVSFNLRIVSYNVFLWCSNSNAWCWQHHSHGFDS